MRDWAQMIMRIHGLIKQNIPIPTLAFDSYYSTNASLQLFQGQYDEIKVLAAINASKFTDIELLETLANKKPGILEAFQNKKTGDVVVIYEEPSSKLGRMIALSNAFVVENDQQDPARKPEYVSTHVPLL